MLVYLRDGGQVLTPTTGIQTSEKADMNCHLARACLLVGCLMSKQHASVSQGWRASAYLNNRHTDKWRGRHKLPTTGIQTSEEADMNCHLSSAYLNNRHTDKWRGRHKLPTTGIQTSEEADINCQQQAYRQVKRQTWTATCQVLTSTTGIQTSEEADINCQQQAYRQVKRQT